MSPQTGCTNIGWEDHDSVSGRAGRRGRRAGQGREEAFAKCKPKVSQTGVIFMARQFPDYIVFSLSRFFYLCNQSGDSQVPCMWNRKFQSPALDVCKKCSKIIGSWVSPLSHYDSSGWSLGIYLHIFQSYKGGSDAWSELSTTALEYGVNFEDFTIQTNSWNVESIMGGDKDREKGTVLRKKHFQRMSDLSSS